MFLIFAICMIGASACASVVNSVAKDEVLTAERKNVALIASALGMALGFFLLQYGKFNADFYDGTKWDFLDYGKLTGEGWMHLFMGTCGLVAVAENILAVVNMFVEEIKQTIRSKHE